MTNPLVAAGTYNKLPVKTLPDGAVAADWLTRELGKIEVALRAPTNLAGLVFDFDDFARPGSDDTSTWERVENTAADAGGGTIILPPRVLRFEDELRARIPLQILGLGRGITRATWLTLGANKSGWKVTSDNVFFRDLSITGPSAGTYVVEENGITWYGTSGARLTSGGCSNVELSGFGSYGALAEYADDIAIGWSRFHSMGYAAVTTFSGDGFMVGNSRIYDLTPGTSGNAYGIVATSRSGGANPSDFVFAGNRVTANLVWEAIDTHGGQGGVIIGNVIANCKYGINVSPDASDVAPSFVTIIGNTIRKGAVSDPGRAIGSGGSATSQAVGIVSDGNIIYEMGVNLGTDGAELWQYCTAPKIHNTYVNCRSHGLVIGVGMLDIDVHYHVSGLTNGGVGNPAGVKVDVAGATGLLTGYSNAGDQYPLHINAACPGLYGDGVYITSGAAPASGVEVLTPNNGGNQFPFGGGLRPVYAAKSADYTLTVADGTITMSASGGNRTVTLPTVTKVARQYVVKKTDATANTVTVQGAGGSTIDGGTYVLTVQYQSVTVEADGTNWHVVAVSP